MQIINKYSNNAMNRMSDVRRPPVAGMKIMLLQRFRMENITKISIET